MTLEEYMERLIPHALILTGTVRDEGTDATARVLAAVELIERPGGVDPKDALCVILAAMVGQERTQEQLLGWTRGLQPVQVQEPPPATDIDWLKVELICNSDLPYSCASNPEKREVVKRLNAAGHADPAIAVMTGTTTDAVLKLRSRMGIPAVNYQNHAVSA